MSTRLSNSFTSQPFKCGAGSFKVNGWDPLEWSGGHGDGRVVMRSGQYRQKHIENNY